MNCFAQTDDSEEDQHESDMSREQRVDSLKGLFHFARNVEMDSFCFGFGALVCDPCICFYIPQSAAHLTRKETPVSWPRFLGRTSI